MTAQEQALEAIKQHWMMLKPLSKREELAAFIAIGTAILDDLHGGDISQLRDKHKKTGLTLRKVEKLTGVPISRLSKSVAVTYARKNVAPEVADRVTLSVLQMLGKEDSGLDPDAIRTLTDAVFAKEAEPKWDTFVTALEKFKLGETAWTAFVDDVKVAKVNPAAFVADVDIDDVLEPSLVWDGSQFYDMVMADKAAMTRGIRSLPYEHLAAMDERLALLRKIIKDCLPNKDKRRGNVIDYLRCVLNPGGPHVYDTTLDGGLVCICGLGGMPNVVKEREEKQRAIEAGRQKAVKVDKKAK